MLCQVWRQGIPLGGYDLGDEMCAEKEPPWELLRKDQFQKEDKRQGPEAGTNSEWLRYRKRASVAGA